MKQRYELGADPVLIIQGVVLPSPPSPPSDLNYILKTVVGVSFRQPAAAARHSSDHPVGRSVSERLDRTQHGADRKCYACQNLNGRFNFLTVVEWPPVRCFHGSGAVGDRRAREKGLIFFISVMTSERFHPPFRFCLL